MMMLMLLLLMMMTTTTMMTMMMMMMMMLMIVVDDDEDEDEVHMFPTAAGYESGSLLACYPGERQATVAVVSGFCPIIPPNLL